MLRDELEALLDRGRTVGSELLCLETVDSTNSEVRRRALAGAGAGLAVLADGQTGGRGRLGRSFVSPAGKGLYCSLLLRPTCPPRALLWLTAWTAVAVCDAVETVCGVRPGIKWTNDLVLNGKKLGGILTELEGDAARPAFVTVGIGLNLSQDGADFGPEVAPLAISLLQALGTAPRREALGAALLTALDGMYTAFPAAQARYLAAYRADCLTTGRPVRVLRPGRAQEAFAEGLDDDFALMVRYPDGRRETLHAGEVSVRGLCGAADEG